MVSEPQEILGERCPDPQIGPVAVHFVDRRSSIPAFQYALEECLDSEDLRDTGDVIVERLILSDEVEFLIQQVGSEHLCARDDRIGHVLATTVVECDIEDTLHPDGERATHPTHRGCHIVDRP